MTWRVDVDVRVGDLTIDVDLEGDATPVALIGPNGSGKTTLLRVIAGAYTPDRGEVVVDDDVLFSTTRGVDRPSEERRVGYVPQGYGLFDHLSVLDNVAFGLSTGIHKRSRTQRRRDALKILTDLDCAELADRRPVRLSGGEKQRVALARALVIDPKLLLLDEPLAALDVASRRIVRVFLAERLGELARASIVVTHDIRDIEAIGASIGVLDRGRLVQRGTPAALRAAPCNDFVAEFLG